jgi:hypothetical protein
LLAFLFILIRIELLFTGQGLRLLYYLSSSGSFSALFASRLQTCEGEALLPRLLAVMSAGGFTALVAMRFYGLFTDGSGILL